MAEQTIFRTSLNKDFTVLPNAMLRDSRLSFKARGILALILTNQSEWVVTSKWLEEQGLEGREAIRSATEELKECGYAFFLREKNDKGQFNNVWCFYDSPQDAKNPNDGKPSSANKPASDGNPNDGNPSYIQKNNDTEELTKKDMSGQETGLPKNRSSKKTEFPSVPEKLATAEFLTAWADWLEDRRARRKPVTALAAVRQLKEMESWGPTKAVLAINTAIAKGWQGIFEPKGVPNFGQPASRQENPFAAFTS